MYVQRVWFRQKLSSSEYYRSRLPALSDCLSSHVCLLFGHVIRLAEDVPANGALRLVVNLAIDGIAPSPQCKRPAGSRPRRTWLSQLWCHCVSSVDERDQKMSWSGAIALAVYSPNSTIGSSRLDTTRSTCRANAFWLCRACRTARLDTLVLTRLDSFDTSNVSSRVETWHDEQSGIWAYSSIGAPNNNFSSSI